MDLLTPIYDQVSEFFEFGIYDINRESNTNIFIYSPKLVKKLGPFPKGVIFDQVEFRLDEESLDIFAFNPRLGKEAFLPPDIEYEYDELGEVPYYNLIDFLNFKVEVTSK